VTSIFVSRKIERVFKSLELKDRKSLEGKFNSWNAHYATLDRKKYWTITHSFSRYSVYLPDFKAKDLKYFREIFIDRIISQLRVSKAENKIQSFDPSAIDTFIGDVSFHKTNNDRSAVAYINKRIEELKYWYYYREDYSYISLDTLAAHMNILGSKIIDGKNEFNYPTTEFLEIIHSSA
jgi:hypothetical protein